MNQTQQNPMNSEMLEQLIGQNKDIFNRAQQMCAGKTPDQMKQIAINLLQSQGRDVSELNNLASMLGFRI